MTLVKVASKNDVKSGEGKTVSAGGKEIALFNIDGQFFAIDNTCAHRGGPLGEGMLEGNVVTCPFHGWKFNVQNGSSVMPPGAKVKSFAVKLEGDDIMLEV
ncbi:MAG: Rieske 2Fe-2S domain-containing protein [Candidatus Aenigmarchaeota archaeon]|nr:Rieske 2Fe-2S domain-containing protein [Candidatus Aenigmarchaeota archaeon]